MVKAVVLISVDPVKVGPVLAIVKTHADPAKADAVRGGPVLATVKTHAHPAKAIGISLSLNAMMPKVC